MIQSFADNLRNFQYKEKKNITAYIHQQVGLFIIL